MPYVWNASYWKPVFRRLAGGLDMAVQAVFGGEVVWHSEIDKAASKVLAYRFPGTPNLGDITQIDWAAVPPVDILCGGFPCTDVSAAGKRAGMHGTRSGLWSEFAKAIDILKPRIVVIENVRGLLSAHANRPMESDDVSVGDGGTVPVLRALGAVLGDLCDLGYDAQWATVSAASVGAPHRRERVFILANLADTTNIGCEDRGYANAADASRVGWDEGRPEPARIVGGFDAAVSGDAAGRVELLPTPRASDPANTSSHSSEGFRPQLGEVVRQLGGERRDELGEVVDNDGAVPVLPTDGGGVKPFRVALNGDGVAVNVCGAENSHSTYVPAELAGTKCDLLPAPTSWDGKGRNQRDDETCLTGALLPTPAAADGQRGQDYARADRDGSGGDDLVTAAVKAHNDSQWGKYAAAIARWEQIAGPAPAPTEPNRNGKPRLNPEFSSWMMGWPAGWVTDPNIGISRNDQLRCVGNGVVPQQAVAAIRYLLSVAVTA